MTAVTRNDLKETVLKNTVLNKNVILKIIREHRNEIKPFGVSSLGLFGSFVNDSEREDSDIDILVEFEPGKKTYNNLFCLHEYLENIFERKIDLVTKEGVSKYIRPYIEESVIYERL